MSTIGKTTINKGGKGTTTYSTDLKESGIKMTGAKLYRLGGFAAMAAGLLFVGVQAIHPLDILSSVTTAQWAIVHLLGIAMGIFALFGITAIYSRQVEKAGWLGFAGFLLYSLFWAVTFAFQFIEAFISPLLATSAPQIEESVLGMIKNTPGGVDLGTLPTVWLVTGLLYMLGGALFGTSTFRAGVMPRWAGALLAVSSVLPLVLSSLVPHPYDRIFAVPVGLALAWMGYALFSERRNQTVEQVSASNPNAVNPEPQQVA